MKRFRFLAADKGAIAGLAIFLLTLALVMWTHSLVVAQREATAKTLHFAGIRNDYGSAGAPPHQAYAEPPEMKWSVRSAYSHGQDSIVIDLSQGEVPVDDELTVFANFVENRRQGAANSHWLTRESNGRYRASGVNLGLGTWIMGLTGYRNSNIAFRLEQTLTVK